MNKLLISNLLRLKKNKLYMWLTGIVALFSLMLVLRLFSGKVKPPIDGVLFFFVLPIGVAAALFGGIFFGTEYGDGTMRNKIIIGHGRNEIYLANFITLTFCTFGFFAAYMIPVLIIGFPCFGLPTMGGAEYVKILLTSLTSLISFCAVYTAVSMVYANKAGATVINLLFVFLFSLIEFAVIAALIAPETIQTYGIGGVMEYIPNPSYVSGVKRGVYQFIADLLPMGQAIQILTGGSVVLWRMSVYSIAIVAVATGIGIYVFRRKNIK